MTSQEAAVARPPAQVPPPLVPGLRGLLTLAVGVVLITGLYLGREVFIPLVLIALLAFVLAPVVNGLRGIRLKRVPSVIGAVLLALTGIGGIGAVIGTQVAGLAGNLPAVSGHRFEAVRRPAAGLARRRQPRRRQVRPPGLRRDLESGCRRHDRCDTAMARAGEASACQREPA